VVQVYSGQQPEVKLVGFARVQLAQGEERVVTVPVERRLLSSWDEKTSQWIAPKGEVTFRVGSNSADLPLAKDAQF
jgi:beta-glucosidase